MTVVLRLAAIFFGLLIETAPGFATEVGCIGKLAKTGKVFGDERFVCPELESAKLELIYAKWRRYGTAGPSRVRAASDVLQRQCARWDDSKQDVETNKGLARYRESLMRIAQKKSDELRTLSSDLKGVVEHLKSSACLPRIEQLLHSIEEEIKFYQCPGNYTCGGK